MGKAVSWEKTGEIRPPLCGEWFENSRGCPEQARLQAEIAALRKTLAVNDRSAQEWQDRYYDLQIEIAALRKVAEAAIALHGETLDEYDGIELPDVVAAKNNARSALAAYDKIKEGQR